MMSEPFLAALRAAHRIGSAWTVRVSVKTAVELIEAGATPIGRDPDRIGAISPDVRITFVFEASEELRRRIIESQTSRDLFWRYREGERLA